MNEVESLCNGTVLLLELAVCAVDACVNQFLHCARAGAGHFVDVVFRRFAKLRQIRTVVLAEQGGGSGFRYALHHVSSVNGAVKCEDRKRLRMTEGLGGVEMGGHPAVASLSISLRQSSPCRGLRFTLTVLRERTCERESHSPSPLCRVPKLGAQDC